MNQPAGPLLECRGLAAGYGALAVVRDLDLRVEAGEVVALIGPNGAGKTTTLLTLAGELPAISGEVVFRGAATKAPLFRRARQGMGFVTEERSVFMQLSTEENLRVAGVARADAVALFPELEPLMGRTAGLLSGGEQQMLTLARAVARDPSLLLVDELSLGLAPVIVRRLLQTVRRVATERSTGILLVEQHVRQALHIADRVYVMQRGPHRDERDGRGGPRAHRRDRGDLSLRRPRRIDRSIDHEVTMTDPNPISFDRDAINEKYAQERDKRMIEGRAATRDLSKDEDFSSYRDDPFTPYVERDSIDDEIDVAIIGAGIAGVVAGSDLRAAGIKQIRLIDGAGGIGGTWYWNRYPGVMCDVESYVYMPKLEEMGYVPTTRYAFGDEIRRHLDAVAQRYDLVDSALFHTTVQESRWDEESARWILTTDRGDVIRAHYLIVAPGILHLMKLPVIEGMEKFHGRAFHSARWDYDYTGGAPDDPHMDKLGDKVVGIIGSGGSGIQAVPPLAESAKHLYVFQRTPSAIGVRDNQPTPPDFAEDLEPGWQRRRMENFSAVMIGVPVERDFTDDGWTHHMAKVMNPEISEGMSLEDIGLAAEQFDYSVMEEHRARVSEIVHDPRVAEGLKPYYRYLCKRPLFHDEYLPTFNRGNVTLVDSPAGLDCITERGIVVDGEEIALDCIVYATGFEAESTPLPRRATHPIIGRGGVSLAEKFADGPITLFGLMTGGFPNMFLMPAPALQSVVTVNYTHLAVVGAEHIAGTIAMLEQRGVRVADVLPEAEADWTAEIVSGFQDTSGFMAACTPSRLNFEGDMSKANPRAGSYGGGGFGDFFAYQQLLRDWRASGEFAGLRLDEGADAAR